ncbi:MAG: hypothetical protein GY861_11920 [bacterium]|nr:hypothetical protein [bacterium]
MTNEIAIKDKPSTTQRILEVVRAKSEITRLRNDVFRLKLKQCGNYGEVLDNSR